MGETDLAESSVDESEDNKKSGRELLLEVQARTLERRVLKGGASDTFRGIRDTGLERLGIDIAQEINGKVVADIGSGMGGIAKTASVEQIPTTIYSVNPHLAIEKFKATEEEVTERALRKRYPDITDEQIAVAQQYHDSHLSTNFAHNLVDFSDNFFDVIIDNIAVNAYMPEGYEELYEETMREMLRVLGPGGKIVIVDGYKESVPNRGDAEKILLKERILQKIGCRYEPKVRKDGVPLGTIIYKDKD